MTTETKSTECTAGWGSPLSSKKYHFFNNSARSLCGRWAFTGVRTPDIGIADQRDCAGCTRKALKDGLINREPKKASTPC